MRTALFIGNADRTILDALAKEYPDFELHVTQGSVPDELVERAEVIATGGHGSTLLPQAKNLKWLHTLSAGVDWILPEVDRLFGDDVIVSNSSGIYGVPIAEHLLAMMLSFSHCIPACMRDMQRRQWNRHRCRELSGATVGIVGMGDIGSSLVAMLEPFRTPVLGWRRTRQEPPEGVNDQFFGPDGLDELLRRSDYVAICLPGTPETRGLFDARRLALMKPTAVLLNIGRGFIVDHDALAEALSQGKLAGAGLDVTEPEPLPPEHPLWGLENVLITPHISGLTDQWPRRVAEHFACNFRAWAQGQPLPSAVDRVHRY